MRLWASPVLEAMLQLELNFNPICNAQPIFNPASHDAKLLEHLMFFLCKIKMKKGTLDW